MLNTSVVLLCQRGKKERERERPKTDRRITSSAKRENLRSTKTQERKNMNLVPSRLSGLLVLPKPPPGICVDVRDGVPVERGHLPRRFCVFKGERVREREFTRVSHKGRPKFKNPECDEKQEENTPACVHILNIPRVNVL